MMKVLVAPLNWGLGHASRCVPLVQRFLDEGHEVILGGDGDSLTLLRKHFPKLRYVYLAPLNLRYSKGSRQVFAMLRAIPQLIAWSVKDHAILRAILREEHIDKVISDNRFGLYLTAKRSNSPKDGLTAKRSNSAAVYITHQLHIMFPRGWRWMEPLAERLHARVWRRFDEVWVPDYEDPANSLAGEMSHLSTLDFRLSTKIRYIGPLSRFDISTSQNLEISNHYDIVAVLSGLEPHRTLLEKEIIAKYRGTNDEVLIVQGLPSRPKTTIKRGNITIMPYLSDAELVPALLNARHIIARSGYSTVMDLHALGLLKESKCENEKMNKLIEIIPTPGQPEQEYLAEKFAYVKKK